MDKLGGWGSWFERYEVLIMNQRKLCDCWHFVMILYCMLFHPFTSFLMNDSQLRRASYGNHSLTENLSISLHDSGEVMVDGFFWRGPFVDTISYKRANPGRKKHCHQPLHRRILLQKLFVHHMLWTFFVIEIHILLILKHGFCDECVALVFDVTICWSGFH